MDADLIRARYMERMMMRLQNVDSGNNTNIGRIISHVSTDKNWHTTSYRWILQCQNMLTGDGTVHCVFEEINARADMKIFRKMGKQQETRELLMGNL